MPTSRGFKLHIYQDARGEFRWRMVASNGKTVADSGEGYKRRSGAVKAAVRVIEAPKSLVTA